MKSVNTLIREKIKDIFLLLDYYFWLLADPCKFKRIKKERIKKVVIISLGAIGELLVLTTLVSALKKSLNCEISFMVRKGEEGILRNNPNISEILIYEKSFQRNVERLKEMGFDLAILHYPVSMKIALMCLFSKIKYRIGGIGSLRQAPAFFITKKTFPITKKHVVEESLHLIRQIGIDNKNPKLEFYVSKKAELNAEKILKKLKVKKYVVVQPSFSFINDYKYPSRLWPMKNYAKIVDYLVEKYGVDVLLTGSKNEKKWSDKIMKYIKNKKNVKVTSGIFNFEEIAHVISKAKLFIGTSTSPLHLAECFNTPIIELAGQHDRWQWDPWISKERYRVLYHEEVCTGCNLMYCPKKNIECMNSISVNEVTNAIKELEKHIR